jgi:hypothetical protein
MSTAKVITEFEKGVKLITELSASLEIKPREAGSGVSYFKGKNRLCKILNTKKGIKLELNVIVPKAIENKFKLDSLTEKEAKDKHLGTMKYKAFTLSEVKELKEVVEAALKAYKTLYEPKVEEAKEEPKASEETKEEVK